ncbi:hypothetical protein [Anaerotignum sp. MB30-C6]|uniref:hypothetical protein n=1 Tax=Anaerotignum sp. MB30-C6 TaxID=3070814 RepID=UPI0027DB26CF|nr:hypothetical protein [Anaerotignum sp. MB30-C6]WMI82075.1 hypothetical protein RBQ60_04900 [Anaerotignum sp. MB30-C6]
MKFSKIATLAKRNKTAILMLDEDGQQWLSTGSAAYRLENMPILDEDTVLTVMGVSDDSREKWFTKCEDEPARIIKNDLPDEEEITADDAGISVIYAGSLLTPIYTLSGVIWLDTELLAPTVKKEEAYKRYFIRNTGKRRAVAVKDGMVLSAVIMEYIPESTSLFEAVDTLADRCRVEAKRTIAEECSYQDE